MGTSACSFGSVKQSQGNEIVIGGVEIEGRGSVGVSRIEEDDGESDGCDCRQSLFAHFLHQVKARSLGFAIGKKLFFASKLIFVLKNLEVESFFSISLVGLGLNKLNATDYQAAHIKNAETWNGVVLLLNFSPFPLNIIII